MVNRIKGLALKAQAERAMGFPLTEATMDVEGDEIVRGWLIRPGGLGEWFLGAPLWERSSGYFLILRVLRTRDEALTLIPEKGW